MRDEVLSSLIMVSRFRILHNDHVLNAEKQNAQRGLVFYKYSNFSAREGMGSKIRGLEVGSPPGNPVAKFRQRIWRIVAQKLKAANANHKLVM